MKTILLLILFFLVPTSQTDPVKVVQKHIDTVEEYFSPNQKGKAIFDIYYFPSIEFLQDLTGIYCDKSMLDKSMLEPSKKNISDWKNWLKTNKNKLYWNEPLKKVMVVSTTANPR